MAGDEVEILSFQVVPSGPSGNWPVTVPVEIRTHVAVGQLADEDEVEVSGFWDGSTLDADQIVNLSAGARPKQRRSQTQPSVAPETAPKLREKAPKPREKAPKPREKAPKGGRGRIVALLAIIAVIVVTAGAVLYFTDGFGMWTRPGPIVKPVSATVFSPDGAPDNPQKAELAIDGNPDTGWSTVAYKDADPFPKFIEGMGLMLHLSEPTALSAVTIDVSSTGTEVQIRSSPTDAPTKLADTTELTPTTPLQKGHNTIAVHDRSKTSNVLVWISTLGTTDGQSRTEISEITLQAAG